LTEDIRISDEKDFRSVAEGRETRKQKGVKGRNGYAGIGSYFFRGEGQMRQ